jgi:hypothetical protein
MRSTRRLGDMTRPTDEETKEHPRSDQPPPKTRRADGDEDLDAALDEALKDTFPASDPIAVHEQRPR